MIPQNSICCVGMVQSQSVGFTGASCPGPLCQQNSLSHIVIIAQGVNAVSIGNVPVLN